MEAAGVIKQKNVFIRWFIILVFCILVKHAKVTKALPDIIKIGGLFDLAESKQEVAFRYAVERVNANRKILSQSLLSAIIEKIPPQDSFHASKRVCHLLRSGVAALFGPQSGTTSSHVQSICDAMEIPHIETRWDYRLRRDEYSVNLYPHPSALSKAYVHLIERFGWKSYTILYEDNQGLVRLQELLKSPTQSDVKIVVRQLPQDEDYRELLKEIKKAGEIHIVLDCSTEKIQSILTHAAQVGMMTAYHNYLITSLDLHMVNLDDFRYGGTNITAFRLLDPERDEVKQVVQDWIFGEMRYGRKMEAHEQTIKGLNQTVLKTETALIYDAVHLYAQALHDLDRSQEINTKPLSCDGTETWQHGNSLVNYMKLVEMKGLTGTIKFDQHGLRTDFSLEVVELKKEGLAKVGTWNEKTGVNFTRNFTESYTEIVESLQNKTLIVTTIYSPPYSMYRDSQKRLTGNDVFEGYAIDLIKNISEILRFNYTFKWVDDHKYGKRNRETGEWNGMMGELLAQKADLAIADLTITYEREQAVDFTMPFMNLGVSILFKKPMKKPPNLFSFLSPLSLDVWLYMAAAYLGVSVLLFILARFSPYEWDNPHPCRTESDVLVNDFSLVNSMWFTIGSLMQQGSDLSPKAISTRMVAGMWWFFTLIMISSYTANLAAFLTVERMESPIESAEDLAKQTKIKYGCVESGSTGAFFRDSKIPTYQRMWSFMESTKPSVFTSGNTDGIEKVKKGNGKYAFLMESTTIEYVIERECDTTQIGGLLDSKGYGIALPPGSPYRTPISSAILKLQESGQLHVLKRKWWKQKRGGGQCAREDDKASKANELSLANVGGVFVVLLAGMGLACLIAVFEFIWKSRKLATEDNIDVWTEMAKEMKQNFGRHQSKSVTKPDSAMGSGGRGSGSSWGMNAIPPLTSAGHSVAIQQQISAHSAAAQEQNNLSIASPGDEDNNDSNNSSIQSNSNSEFSDINDSHGGGGHGPTVCQVATVRQRSANTPTPKRNYNQQFAHHDHHLLEDEDPYGPMSSHFYTGARNRIQLRSNSVLTSPVTTSKCAYHTTNSAASTNQPNNTTTTLPLRGSSADIRHYAVKAISNRQYQSGSDLHGQG